MYLSKHLLKLFKQNNYCNHYNNEKKKLKNNENKNVFVLFCFVLFAICFKFQNSIKK